MSEIKEEREKTGVLTTTMKGVEAVSKEDIEKILKEVDKEASARKPASAKNVPMVPKARKATASPQGAPKGQKGQGSPP